MKDLRIRLTPKEASILLELFSSSDEKTKMELLEHLSVSARERLLDKIRSEMEYAKFRRAFDIAHSSV